MRTKGYLWREFWVMVQRSDAMSIKKLIELMIDYLCQEYKRQRKIADAYAKMLAIANPEKQREWSRRYVLNNPEEVRLAQERYRQKPQTKRQRNEYYKRRRQTDPQFRLKKNLRVSIFCAIKSMGAKKRVSSQELTGCSIEHLRSHIESLWEPGMSWENWGTWKTGQPMTWHIDHKLPCNSFDLTDPEQQKTCFHWSNLQPLWAIDNMRKRDHLPTT